VDAVIRLDRRDVTEGGEGMTVSTLAPRARRKMQPPPPADPVTQYALDVVAGRLATGELVRKAAERHVADLADGPARGLSFDVAAAQRAIDFFPLLRHYKGEWGRPTREHPKGRPIVLEPWQQFAVGSAFGWKREDDTRRFRSVYVEVAKKNGKTLMAAGIGLLLTFFDGEPGAEVYSGATKRDQAKLVWLDADMMVSRNPTLKKRLRRYALSLVDERTASSFKPLGKDSDTDQGINVHGAIIDELHIHKDRELIDNLETATSARAQPMTVKITTAGSRGATVWEEERSDAVAVVEGRATDDAMLVLIYTLDEGDDPFDEAMWPKANPNLGVSVNVDTLREQAAAAQRSPGRLAAFLRFRMNVPTSVATRAISIDEWDQCAGEPVIPDGAIVYAGLDLASVRDLSALILVHRDEDDVHHVLCHFWCPEEGIEHRSRVDGVPYADWVRDGYLIATPGGVTDYEFIREEVLHLAETYEIRELAFDRWNATQLTTQLSADGATCVAVSQTAAGLAPAWRETEKILLEHRFRHGAHPVLRWMAGNVEAETDAAGNQRPSKARSTERIDGMVALTMAESRWMTHVEVVIEPMVALR
jgi:phage terminase large subunit-like protein